MIKRTFATLVFCFMASSTMAAEKEALFTQRSLTPEVALELAQATLAACRDAGYQVGIAVVDRGGNLQVALRDRYAGPHTPETARRKAWTAVSFRVNSSELVEPTSAGKPTAGVRQVPGALILGGGVVIRAAGDLVGAVGVSGAPGGDADEGCAVKGLETIQDRLDF